VDAAAEAWLLRCGEEFGGAGAGASAAAKANSKEGGHAKAHVMVGPGLT